MEYEISINGVKTILNICTKLSINIA